VSQNVALRGKRGSEAPAFRRGERHKPIKFSIGPICYAGGQLLIALSCSYLLQP
jgi:hypothetical protein